MLTHCQNFLRAVENSGLCFHLSMRHLRTKSLTKIQEGLTLANAKNQLTVCQF
jgi:hypothetical protein